MKNNVWSLTVVLFVLLAGVGILLAALSLTLAPADTFVAKGLRALGLSFFLLGFGEYLNHPRQKTLRYNEQDDSGPLVTFHRSRNPCGLGNTLDVVALISFFIALGFFFFPYSL